MPKHDIEIHEKLWGRELWIVNDYGYCGKILQLNRGCQCSLHYHIRKHETFYLNSGKIILELCDEKFEMNPGDAIAIDRGNMHRFYGIEDSEIIEFSTTHYDNDSYRLEESRKVSL
jgi:mannose-6-phosphate isomerase-like protein (cupin superfamily)